MIIDCIGCLHGCKPALLGGDLLIVTGDLTARDEAWEHDLFQDWIDEQDYVKKIVIAGNHDGFLERKGYHIVSDYMKPIKYLEDTSTKFESVKIYGSPWTPSFGDWHFMKERGNPIKEMWDKIPEGIEILITHGPPFGIQDQTKREHCCGCEELRIAIDRIRPRLHVFSHIHEGYGHVLCNGVLHVNCAIMNEHYKPLNKPIRVLYEQTDCRVLR